jgi:hypothetical protein
MSSRIPSSEVRFDGNVGREMRSDMETFEMLL